MPRVRYPAMIVANPATGLALLEARGAVGYVYAEGTTTRLTLTEESGATIPQPITISPDGYRPTFWVEEGLTRATFVPVSGGWSTPLTSPEGLEQSAAESAANSRVAAAAAVQAQAAAEGAALAAGGASDASVSSMLSDTTSATRRVLDQLIGTAGAKIGTALGTAADASTVVTNTGDQIIKGVKEFVTAPKVPDGAFAQIKVAGLVDALTNLGNAIAGRQPLDRYLDVFYDPVTGWANPAPGPGQKARRFRSEEYEAATTGEPPARAGVDGDLWRFLEVVTP